MKNCPNCKYEVNDTAKFCKKCGFNIKKYEEENADIYCEECGAKISSDSQFCEECGFRITKDKPKKESRQEVNLDLDTISSMAAEQLFVKEGFVVENDVLFSYKGRKRNITITNVDEIYNGAFENNDIIAFVDICEGVSIIGKKAFANCSSLVEVNIPSSCKKVYENAFEGTRLDTLILSEMNYETIFYCLSENAKKHLTKEDYKEFIENKCNQFYVSIKGLEKKAISVAEQKEADKKRYAELDKAWSVGNTQFFGSCCQRAYNDDIKDPIEWIVLERDGSKALLISNYIIDSRELDEYGRESCHWKSCTLRSVLNDELFNEYFTDDEKDKIFDTYVGEEDSSTVGKESENVSKDKLFILSYDEEQKYLKGREEVKAQPTPFVECFDDSGKWWTRTMDDEEPIYWYYVDRFGFVDDCPVDDCCGVRPAMWVDVDKIIAEKK